MCGIFGQIGTARADEACGLSIRHRGPDDSGTECFQVPSSDLWITLVHRRLSIIDLSPAGHQPMCNEDGSVWITFNGEIYNFQEIRNELIAAGHRFRSATDSEVIVHGYEQWGCDVVQRLRGMFAFAIWDQKARSLFLAIDRLGKKPLFYSRTLDGFAFGSEIKTLLAAGVPAELDPVALHDYLTYLYYPHPRTAFKNIFKLSPAHAMRVQLAQDDSLDIRAWQYWDPVEVAGSVDGRSEADLLDEARHLMQEAVKLRLVSDVPLGLFLSGGLDSSAITAFASQASTEQVKTFTIGFRNSRFYNEGPVADLVARKFNTDHHVLEADESCAEHLTTVVRHFDEPFGNPTAILEYILTKLMRQHVTVAISGDGGDEVFGGYVRYSGANLARKYRTLPQFVTRGIIARFSSLLGESTDGRHSYRRLREFAASAWQPEQEMYLNWVGYFSEAEKQELYSSEFADEIRGRDSGDFLRALFQKGSRLEPLNRLGYVDMFSFLCGNCLEYADRMSMANALEVRAPFTDQKLVEFSLRLPAHMKIRGTQTKWMLRQAMKDILPAEVIGKKKMGFNPPLPQWIHGELKPVIEQFLSPEAVGRRGMFRPDAIQQLMRDHESGRRDNALKIWALLMTEVWMRMYFDQEGEDNVREAVLAAASSGRQRLAVSSR